MARMFCAVFAAIFGCFSMVSGLQVTPGTPQSLGQPWPMPQVYKPTADTLILTDDTFRFKALTQSCDILEDAFDRYFYLIFRAGREDRVDSDVLRFKPKPWNHAKNSLWQFDDDSNNGLNSLDVTLSSPCEKYPSLDMDESYDLKVIAGSASLTANGIWGALRGLETFSQLVYENVNDEFQINVTTIHDFPRFTWRGVLLDTSRHFLPKEMILQNLEAMAYNKMNVFHWHITDDQSFPYQSRDYPDLSDKGAFDPYHVYTQEDLKDIIEFARKRGIRVVPEFDSPGHTQSWGDGQPDLLTKCYNKGSFTGGFGPIDPSVNTTYTFLKGFVKELTEVFPDKYIHLGGDEVSFHCWETNPAITTFMQKKGYGKNYAKLEEYYMQSLLDIVASYNSGYIIWQEVVDNGVKVASDTVVEVWKGQYQKEMNKVTNDGYRAILSSCWYLNYISYGPDWNNYYKCDPQKFNGTAKQKDLVIGGEMCMWGEFVDATNVISRTWPRGGAVAERLWSPATMVDPNVARPRMEEQRCRMIRRGLNAEPVSGPGHCKYEYSSGSWRLLK